MKKTITYKMAVMSIFIAVGTVLQAAEGMFFVPVPVPGGKIGLANVVSMLSISVLGGINAIIVSAVRSILGCLLHGGISAVPYSLAGALVSTAAMWCAVKFADDIFSYVGIGIIGAVTHNAAQVVVASLVFSNAYVLTYIPVLTVIGIISGSLTGICSRTLSVFSPRWHRVD